MMVSPHSVARSSLEEMLDSLRRRDEGEQSKDLPPALPSRPTSKARLPKRLIQAKLAMEHAVSRDSTNNKTKLDVNKKQDVNKRVTTVGCNFGRKKATEAAGESPYTMSSVCEERLSENGGATLATPSETEWNDSISYFINNKLGVWCKPRKNQWELAKIKSIVGEEASVMLSDGSMITLSVGELLPANTEVLDGVGDLVELCYVNEPSIVHNLQYRYSRDLVYSKAGPVLLAINPFKEVNIYGSDVVTSYKEKSSDKPHVYAMADSAYHDMMNDGGNQSIIISGVSGSGKTETAKFALQYLASVGSQNNDIKSKLIQTSCILEAFGNAKTSKNNNSSRFGKLIDINYNAEGILSGAFIQTFLLEKSRVSQICRGERSYHIFYQICAGAPPVLKDELNLKMASEYKFLNRSGCLKVNGVDDAHNFIMLVDAFDTLGIPHEDQEIVFELLAAILWLGNISFAVVDKEEHVQPVTDEASRSAARLMGCKMDDLIELLSTDRVNKTTTRLTLQQATVKRDMLVKFVYESLFNWLVEEINASLKGDKQHARHTISIIDTSGFESLQKNSFQQLLINYADERLQQHFIRHLFKQQEEYESDGIHCKKVEFEDNQECLDLFEKKPMGLITILDENSNSSTATDVTFHDKIKQHLSSNLCFSSEKGTFTVHHYAGEVQYDASGLLEQNSDELQPDIIQILSSCKKPLNRLASGMTNKDQTTSPSVATKIKDQLFKLIQQLENSKQHFIRCIKPNTKQVPASYEKDIVWGQLKCSQVMEIVQISKLGYPTSFTHQVFAKRFGHLLSNNVTCVDPLSTTVAILQQHRVPTHTYYVGFTKVFFRGKVDILEYLKKQDLEGTRKVEKGSLNGQVREGTRKVEKGSLNGQVREGTGKVEKGSINGQVVGSTRKVEKGSVSGRGLEGKREVKNVSLGGRVLEGSNAMKNVSLGDRVLLDFHQSKYGILTLQSFVRGENARRKLSSLRKQSQEMTLNSFDVHLTTIVHIQSVVRGWLARKYFNHVQRWKKAAIDNSRNRRRSNSKSSELKGLSQENIQVIPPNIDDLEKRVMKADTLLRERELENRALREQVRQVETKMKVVEETWQSQMASLQMSLAAAKKTLATDGQIGRPDGSVSPNDYDSEDNISGIQTPAQMTPLRLGHNRSENNNGVIPDTVGSLSKEFEQRKQIFDNEAKAVINVNPGLPPSSKQIEDYKILKKRFETWKKEYKHRLREAKSTLANTETGGGGGGGGGGEKRGRHWWGKLSKRGKERAV